MRSLKILHIEDIPSDAEMVERTLHKSDIRFEKVVVDTREEYIKELKEFRPDIILSDHSLPSFNSLEALRILKQSCIEIPFILITSTVSEEFAVNVMKEGATDYVLKDRLQRLPNAIINAIEKFQSDNERLNYLNKIVASEALFKKAEAMAEFGTWRLNVDTKTIDWSAGTYPLLGYTKGELDPSFEDFFKNIFSEDKSLVENTFKNISNLQTSEVDFRVINKDGSIKYIHAQFEFEINEKGKPAYIIGFNQDVTRAALAQLEIQKNIEELKSAADRQTAILNALPPNIVLLNEAGKIVAVNESWRRFTLENNLGIPKYGVDYSYIAISEKATGVDKLSGDKIARGIKEVISDKRNEFSLEYSCIKKNKKVWFQIVVAPLTDKTKKGAVVLHIDITCRKQTEELMLQSEANLKTIFKNTDIAYVLCNSDNKIVSFNTKANEFCLEQFNKTLRVGGNALGYFPKNKIPNAKEALQKVLNNEMLSYETSYRGKDGLVKWYEVRWVGVANDKNVNMGFILAFNDITERKIADLEKDRMTTDLVQRSKDLEQFTYIVSHNLRAPVANILGLSNMLNHFDFNFSESRSVLSALETSINILDRTIIDLNHILEMRSNVHEQNEIVSFQLLVADISLSLNNLIKKENVTINTDFNATDSVISIKSYMYSIFYNIIVNSIKYRQPDKDPVIAILTIKKADKLEILFKDNGRGIDERNLKNVFGLYKRFDTTVEGKGMGLFMVKTQVESLGGRISLQSEPRKGTTFKLDFPDIKYVQK
jgi:PAS domain S-box-containing protein